MGGGESACSVRCGVVEGAIPAEEDPIGIIVDGVVVGAREGEVGVRMDLETEAVHTGTFVSAELETFNRRGYREARDEEFDGIILVGGPRSVTTAHRRGS